MAAGLKQNTRTLFVGLSTPDFNAQVREHLEFYFNIVDSVPPTGVPGGPGVIPHAAVIVAFSLGTHGDLPTAKTIDEVVTAFPDSQYYFIFPDEQPQDPAEPFVDKVLAGRASGRAVVSLRNFVSALEF